MATIDVVAGPDRGSEHSKTFPELSVVSLRRSVSVHAQRLPKGSKGTVVAAYADGQGYEVEFTQPFHAVVTLVDGDLV